MKRIKRFGVLQTAKISAIIYFLIAAVFMIPFALMRSIFGETGFPGYPMGGSMFFIFMPFLYGIIGFITTAIGCLIYNLIASWTGGIELEFETTDEHV